MTDTPTLTHYIVDFTDDHGPEFACLSEDGNRGSSALGAVTCFACRNSTKFKVAQGTEGEIGSPTPLEQRRKPKLLKEIIAEDPELSRIRDLAWLKSQRNERGMYVIEESIHHGDYRSTRRVEVSDINAVTVDAVIQSSPYCYGSWLHPENPAHKEPRNKNLHRLVEDLKHGRTNRAIGWSTFRLLKP